MRKVFLFVFALGLLVLYFLPLNPQLHTLSIEAKGQKIALTSLEKSLNYRGEKFFQFSVKKAKREISKIRAIKSFTLKKKFPGTLYLCYEARFPIALIGNFENRAFDAEGVIFPLYPYFVPMHLPEVYFDLKAEDTIDTNLLYLSKKIIEKLTFEPFFISILDLRNVYKKHIGQQEIALHLLEGPQVWILRFFCDGWEEKLDLFLKNKDFLKAQVSSSAKGYLVDLRLDQLAYISEMGDQIFMQN